MENLSTQNNPNEINETDIAPIPTGEPTVKFQMYSDISLLQIKHPETDEVFVEITGYDLKYRINMTRIKTLEDAELASPAVGAMFKRLLLKEMLENKNRDEDI